MKSTTIAVICCLLLVVAAVTNAADGEGEVVRSEEGVSVHPPEIYF